MKTIITYQAPDGEKINLTPCQVARLRQEGRWLRNAHGAEFCTVSHGRHWGWPSYSDEELTEIQHQQTKENSPA